MWQSLDLEVKAAAKDANPGIGGGVGDLGDMVIDAAVVVKSGDILIDAGWQSMRGTSSLTPGDKMMETFG